MSEALQQILKNILAIEERRAANLEKLRAETQALVEDVERIIAEVKS